MKKIIKYLIIIALFMVMLSISLYNYLRPIDVKSTVIIKENFEDFLKEDGYVVSTNITNISSEVQGVIKKVFFKMGDKIKIGDLILEVDNTEYTKELSLIENQINEYLSNKDQSISNLNNSINLQNNTIAMLNERIKNLKIDYEKSVILYNSGNISESEKKNIKSELNSIIIELEISENLLKDLENKYSKIVENDYTLKNLNIQKDSILKNITKLNIISNNNGYITKMYTGEGLVVSYGQNLLELSGDEFIIESMVLPEDAKYFKIGDKVKLEINNELYNGEIKNIGEITYDSISTLGLDEKRIKIEITSNEKLPFLLGEKIEVSFIKANFPNAIIIPKTALFKELDKSFVFTINNSETLKKEVKYYYESDTYFVIETGLEIGEEIILNYNIENLSEGKRVK